MVKSVKVKGHEREVGGQQKDDYGVTKTDLKRVRKKVENREIRVGKDKYGLVVIYNGRYYSRIVNAALDNARAEYDYPSTNMVMGAKKMLGKQYLVSLMKSYIWASKIPRDLAIALTYRVGL